LLRVRWGAQHELREQTHGRHQLFSSETVQRLNQTHYDCLRQECFLVSLERSFGSSGGGGSNRWEGVTEGKVKQLRRTLRHGGARLTATIRSAGV
jgi:hypothetical protein